MNTLPMTEQQLVTLIINYLNAKGHFVWRNNSGVTHASYTNKSGVRSDRMWRSGIRGGSDIIGIAKDGKFIAIECKVGKNKPTMQQDEFVKNILTHKGYGCIAYSLDDVEKFF